MEPVLCANALHPWMVYRAKQATQALACRLPVSQSGSQLCRGPQKYGWQHVFNAHRTCVIWADIWHSIMAAAAVRFAYCENPGVGWR